MIRTENSQKFLQLTIYSYLDGHELIKKVALLSKGTRQLLQENSLKGLMNDERKGPRQITVNMDKLSCVNNLSFFVLDLVDLFHFVNKCSVKGKSYT